MRGEFINGSSDDGLRGGGGRFGVISGSLGGELCVNGFKVRYCEPCFCLVALGYVGDYVDGLLVETFAEEELGRFGNSEEQTEEKHDEGEAAECPVCVAPA